MSDIGEIIFSAFPHLASPSMQFAWGGMRQRETDDDLWQYTRTGYIILRTVTHTAVLNRVFTGTDGGQLKQECEAWGNQIMELLSEIQCAVVENEMSEINLQHFYEHINKKRGKRRVNTIAKEIGVSPQTFQDLMDGKFRRGLFDLNAKACSAFFLACDWLGVPANTFLSGESEEQS